ncbi:hypothetical protein [Bacillus sp. PS06]|uniref:hypothetical protein n=1 Tax=Bacillus sp. PS06 TaxID=2764176 RepID=UPI001784D392|nr:hypothetical protein [Bacillus sp. PS06]MBD8067862.1 hypothetical protein [Bacillus sp. PS06]
MKAKLVSSFAAGLIVATGISGAVYFLDKSEGTNVQRAEAPSTEEMKELLASTGYVIHTEDEFKEQLAAAEEAASKNNSKEEGSETNEKEDEVKETVIYRTMLTVTTGMTSIDVGEALVKANIIDNAMDFFNDVEKKGLASKLRPGTYEVDSQMSSAQIISVIFK